MPKFFEGDRELLFARISAEPTTITETSLQQELNKNSGAISLCVSFHNFHPNSVGYVFHIKEESDGYHLMNITGESELTLSSLSLLIEAIFHICGYKYSSRVQQVFDDIRNNIGSRLRMRL